MMNRVTYSLSNLFCHIRRLDRERKRGDGTANYRKVYQGRESRTQSLVTETVTGPE